VGMVIVGVVCNNLQWRRLLAVPVGGFSITRTWPKHIGIIYPEVS